MKDFISGLSYTTNSMKPDGIDTLPEIKEMNILLTIGRLTVSLTFFILLLCLTYRANVEAIPVNECHCVDSMRKESVVTCNDFWYGSGGFTYTWHGDTTTLHSTHCYCDGSGGWDVLPVRR